MATNPPAGSARTGGDPGFWRRPAGEATLRGLAILIGLAAAAAVVIVDGFVSIFIGCPTGAEDPSALCRNFGEAVDYVELGLVAVGAIAAFVGGIMSCVRLQARFLLWGLATGAIVTAAIWILADQQVGLLS